MYAFLRGYLAIQPPLKSLPGACDVTAQSSQVSRIVCESHAFQQNVTLSLTFKLMQNQLLTVSIAIDIIYSVQSILISMV